jgi:hypothetical protein
MLFLEDRSLPSFFRSLFSRADKAHQKRVGASAIGDFLAPFEQKPGCPTLAASLFLRLGWDS